MSKAESICILPVLVIALKLWPQFNHQINESAEVSVCTDFNKGKQSHEERLEAF